MAQDRAAKEHAFRLFMVLLPGAPKPDDPRLDFPRIARGSTCGPGVADQDGFRDLICTVTGAPRGHPDGDKEPEQPARKVNLELESGLVETILDDVADRPGTLPLLEYVLLEVWRHRRGRMLTLEAYVACGGVEGGWRSGADAIYDGG